MKPLSDGISYYTNKDIIKSNGALEEAMGISANLLNAIPKLGIVLIAGGVGAGKSCLVYGLMEALHQQDLTRPCLVFNFPEEKVAYLPDYIGHTNDLNFPERGIVIVDEAYMTFHSKDHNSDANLFMDKLSGLARQKELIAFFVTQSTRKLALSQVSNAQALLVKQPDVMMVKLDRRELRSILEAAMKGFRALPVPERREALYVVSTEYEGMLQNANTPPSFWTHELSTAWQGVDLTSRGQIATEGTGTSDIEALGRLALLEARLQDTQRRHPGRVSKSSLRRLRKQIRDTASGS